MIQKRLIGLCRRMVELIDDHHVETIWLDVGHAGSSQTLHRSKNVIERDRAITANPEFAECGVAQGMTERRQTLLKDFLAMGNEEQACTRQAYAQALVIQCRHDSLSGACGGNQQIAGTPLHSGGSEEHTTELQSLMR